MGSHLAAAIMLGQPKHPLHCSPVSTQGGCFPSRSILGMGFLTFDPLSGFLFPCFIFITFQDSCC